MFRSTNARLVSRFLPRRSDGGMASSRATPNSHVGDEQQNLRSHLRQNRECLQLRVACAPTWGYISIDDIFTKSTSGTRVYSVHVLVGNVILNYSRRLRVQAPQDNHLTPGMALWRRMKRSSSRLSLEKAKLTTTAPERSLGHDLAGGQGCLRPSKKSLFPNSATFPDGRCTAASRTSRAARSWRSRPSSSSCRIPNRGRFCLLQAQKASKPPSTCPVCERRSSPVVSSSRPSKIL